MSHHTIILPQKTQLLSRLMRVADSVSIGRELYPLLLAHAGSEQTPESVVELLKRAIEDYAKDRRHRRRTWVKIAITRIPLYLNALIPDQEAAREARTIFLAPKKLALESSY